MADRARNAPQVSRVALAPVLATVVVLAGLAGLSWLGALLLARAARAQLGALRAGAPPLDPVLGLAASTLCALALAWLVAAVGLAVWAELTPRGRAGRVAARLSPLLLRRAVAVVLGTALAAGAATTPASAQDRHPQRRPAAGAGLPAWSADRPAAPARAAGDDAPAEVVVRAGDTLWALAARALGPSAGAAAIDREWRRWYAANRTVIGEDPDLLHPGLRLRAPEPSHRPR